MKVESIIITTKSGKKITLAIEDAKELFGQLEELFGTKQVVVPTIPTVIYRDRWPWPHYQPVWCGDDAVEIRSLGGGSLTFSSQPVEKVV